MQILGILMGLIMAGSFFLSWQAVTNGMALAQAGTFLGIKTNVFFSFLGRELDFLPIVLTLILILAMALGKQKLWKIVGLLSAFLCLAAAARDIRRLLPQDSLKPGIGLWIFAVASFVALVVAVLLLTGKSSGPRRTQETPASYEG
jgi:hypothetical protein